MNDLALLKLLEIVRRELEAEDAYVQLGGAEPSDDHLVWFDIEDSRRLVARMGSIPADRKVLCRRLAAIADAFQTPDAPIPQRAQEASRSEIDQTLADLAGRCKAETAFVCDVHSPMLWGCSNVGSRDLDRVQLSETARVDEAVRQAGLEWSSLLERDMHATQSALEEGLPSDVAGSASRVLETLHELAVNHGAPAVARRLRTARALAAVDARTRRESDANELTLREGDLNLMSREFASIYRLVLVFNEQYSPLHAEAAVQRAIGHVERLVLALPPVDPGGGKARVLRLV